MPIWLESIPAIVTAAVGVAGLLGLTKYLIEPWYAARALRRKYATALWLACSDLELHLKRVLTKIKEDDRKAINALKKIPNNDAKRADWFTKEGYYATCTAYKISCVSAWLRIYQRELLFVPYAASQGFLAKLYGSADELKRAFSTDTCLWFDYLDAVGDGLVARPNVSTGSHAIAPLSFAEFCERYATDNRFRLFYEQVHMFIYFVADKRPSYLLSTERVLGSLGSLMAFLTKERLLPGFKLQRSEINADEVARSVEHQSADAGVPTR